MTCLAKVAFLGEVATRFQGIGIPYEVTFLSEVPIVFSLVLAVVGGEDVKIFDIVSAFLVDFVAVVTFFLLQDRIVEY